MFLSAIEIATEPKAIMQQSQDSPVESLAPKSEHGEKKKEVTRHYFRINLEDPVMIFFLKNFKILSLI
nr:hypothetical protein CFP56_22872 [Quercus suber]